MKILLVCPMRCEYNAAQRIFKRIKKSILYNFHMCYLRVGNNDVHIINSGEGKVRAGIAAAFCIQYVQPDIILDTGSCGSLCDSLFNGTIVVAGRCYEYDISGHGLPEKKLKRMVIRTGFDNFSENCIIKERECVHCGEQACGEMIIDSEEKRKLLRNLFNACACNWETAGVFICALKQNIPCLSIRIVTDQADGNAYKDFMKNIHQYTEKLYNYLNTCIKREWLSYIKDVWDNKKIIV
jgi:adenosylhomocysteine nucleosidase